MPLRSFQAKKPLCMAAESVGAIYYHRRVRLAASSIAVSMQVTVKTGFLPAPLAAARYPREAMAQLKRVAVVAKSTPRAVNAKADGWLSGVVNMENFSTALDTKCVMGKYGLRLPTHRVKSESNHLGPATHANRPTASSVACRCAFKAAPMNPTACI